MGFTKVASRLATTLQKSDFCSTTASKLEYLFVESQVNWRKQIDQCHYRNFKAFDFARQQRQKKASLLANHQINLLLNWFLGL